MEWHASRVRRGCALRPPPQHRTALQRQRATATASPPPSPPLHPTPPPANATTAAIDVGCARSNSRSVVDHRRQHHASTLLDEHTRARARRQTRTIYARTHARTHPHPHTHTRTHVRTHGKHAHARTHTTHHAAHLLANLPQLFRAIGPRLGCGGSHRLPLQRQLSQRGDDPVVALASEHERPRVAPLLFLAKGNKGKHQNN